MGERFIDTKIIAKTVKAYFAQQRKIKISHVYTFRPAAGKSKIWAWDPDGKRYDLTFQYFDLLVSVDGTEDAFFVPEIQLIKVL